MNNIPAEFKRYFQDTDSYNTDLATVRLESKNAQSEIHIHNHNNARDGFVFVFGDGRLLRYIIGGVDANMVMDMTSVDEETDLIVRAEIHKLMHKREYPTTK